MNTWFDRALCLGEVDLLDDPSELRILCKRCPVRIPCLDYGVRVGIDVVKNTTRENDCPLVPVATFMYAGLALRDLESYWMMWYYGDLDDCWRCGRAFDPFTWDYEFNQCTRC